MRHLRTLFWIGPYFQEGDIPSLFLRWRGTAYPDVGRRFKSSFVLLNLSERWIVKVSTSDDSGIRVVPQRLQELEHVLSFEERIQAIAQLRSDVVFMKNSMMDFDTIVDWLATFEDRVS